MQKLKGELRVPFINIFLNLNKFFVLFIFLIGSFFFFHVSPAEAATKYFCGTNGNWSTPTNWKTTSGCTGSTTVAGVSDDVFIARNLTSNTGSAASVNSLTINSPVRVGIPITVATMATFNNGENIGTITGNVTFNFVGSSVGINNGIINGNVTFNDLSSNNDTGIVNGNATFNGQSFNSNIINGNATFNDTSINGGGTITGDVTFHGDSKNGWDLYRYYENSIITGSVIFYDNSYNGGDGTINGNVTFDSIHNHNDGMIHGTATFNSAHAGVMVFDNNQYWGSGTANAVVGDDGLPITSWIFNAGSYNTGVIIGTATFNYAHDGVIILTGYSQFWGGSASSVIGDDGIPITSWIFNEGAYNNGTITGTATFNYAHGGVITIADGGQWGSGTATSNVGDDGLPFSSWIFNGASQNNGQITGDATFNNTSYNNRGIITGNPTFHHSSFNAGSIIGNAIFKDSSSNGGLDIWGNPSTGTISDDAIFLDTSTNYEGSTISGNACFASTATNSGTVEGIASVCTAPVLTTISPTSVSLGDTDFPLTLTGTDFLFNSIVKWNTDTLDTTVISPTELLANVPASKILAIGTPSITVYSPTLSATSSPQTFTINNPTLSTLSPSSVITNSAGFTLAVTGTNFISTSVINWNGTPLTTTYVSPTELNTTILIDKLQFAGTADITVTTPTPGGGTSNIIVFTINPVYGSGPLIEYIAPVVPPPVITPPVALPITPVIPVITPVVPPPTITIPTTPAPQTYNLGTTTLKNGSKGEAVKELQRLLNKLLNLNLTIDGKLGPKTIAVIKKWQKANGLKADGLVGKKTREKMMGGIKNI